jgi:hypothetical protein
MPQNPFTPDYSKWGYLTPLSWVKMLWKSLHHFDVILYMLFLTIPFPRKQDKVIMEIISLHGLEPSMINSLNRCRGALKALFLSDITAADGKYLEQFVFKVGRNSKRSRYKFPHEQPMRQDWDHCVNFWH